MTEFRKLKLRLYPKQAQRKLLEEQLEMCRILSNACIEERVLAWKEKRVRVRFRQQSAELPGLIRALPEFSKIPAQVRQQVVKRVERTFDNFLSGRSKHPRYKGRTKYNSMVYPQVGKRGTLHGGSFCYQNLHIILAKIGSVRYLCKKKPSWHDNAKIKNCVVKREGKNWFAYLCFEVEIEPKQHGKREPIGIDMGLTSLLALSNGSFVENPRHLRHAGTKIARLHQRLDKKKLGSSNRHKARLKLNDAYTESKNKRRDFNHKLTRNIAQNYSLVAVEDNLSGLSQGFLAKHVQDASWGTIRRFLEYKCQEEGGILVVIDKNGTSKECSCCGTSVPKELNDRMHECPKCCLVIDRDTNAAINILNRALIQLEAIELPTDGGKVTLGEMKPLPTTMPACIVVDPRSPVAKLG